MKKIVSLLCLLLLLTGLKAQIVFQENFNSVADGAMPTGWTVFNLDGLTPNSAITAATASGGLGESFANAWNCYDFSASGLLTSRAAWTTSYFTSPGTANRWMFTPAIVVPATNPVIQYNEFTPNSSYPDGYQLVITTTAPTAANITSATVLKTVTAAATT